MNTRASPGANMSVHTGAIVLFHSYVQVMPEVTSSFWECQSPLLPILLEEFLPATQLRGGGQQEGGRKSPNASGKLATLSIYLMINIIQWVTVGLAIQGCDKLTHKTWFHSP